MEKEKDLVIPLVDDWTPSKEDEIVTYDGKLLVINYDKVFDVEKVSNMNYFVIRRDSYVKNLDLISNYLNYFIKYFDDDNELLMAYLKLKYISDSNKFLQPDSFFDQVYKILFTDSLKEKMTKMSKHNFVISVESSGKEGAKYSDALKFSDEHAELLIRVSLAMKIIIPIMLHFIYTHNLSRNINLYYVYEPLLSIFDDNIDVYNKLWVTTMATINKKGKKHRVIWEQRKIFGDSIELFIDLVIRQKLVTEAMFKIKYNENVVNYIIVVIRRQIFFLTKDDYGYNIIDVSHVKDSEGLSGLDKLEMNSSKVDESNIILSNLNINKTIERIKKSILIDIPKEEIEFYSKFHKNHKLQVQIVYYYYAKFFGGYNDLNLVNREQYITLMLLLKRRLQIQGDYVLAQLLSANCTKYKTRTIQNTRFLSKLENTKSYQELIEKKYSHLNDIGKGNIILNMISTLISSQFTYVDYDRPELLGQDIEFNQDILCDEFLSLLNDI